MAFYVTEGGGQVLTLNFVLLWLFILLLVQLITKLTFARASAARVIVVGRLSVGRSVGLSARFLSNRGCCRY